MRAGLTGWADIDRDELNVEAILDAGIQLSALLRRETRIQCCVNVGSQPLDVCAPLKSVAPLFERGPEPLQVQALGVTQR
jgi:hypothetical protein